jgi:hypothetical protein
MASKSVAAALAIRGGETGPFAYSGVAAIGTDDPARTHHAAVHQDSFRRDSRDTGPPGEPYTGFAGGVGHKSVEFNAAYTATVAIWEGRLNAGLPIAETNASKCVSGGGVEIQSQPASRSQTVGQDTFSAGLVHGRGGTIAQSDIEASASRSESRGKTGWTAADHEHVGGMR